MDPSGSTTDVHTHEREFHDHWAQTVSLEELDVRRAFEAPTALENRFILKLAGDLRGKRVLDIGSGLGESSVYFALKGAQVTLTDLSPAMVEFAVALGDRHGVRLEGLVSAAESLDVPENYYDIVYVANLLHHVEDKAAVFQGALRALKPGGKFFSWDPLAYNPVINVYRNMASEVRSDSEAPLTIADIQLAGSYFWNVHHREFWICSLALFLKYYLIDRVNPNQDRYWKRILRETTVGLWWWHPLRWLDEGLSRIPGIRWLAWNTVIWGEKPGFLLAQE